MQRTNAPIVAGEAILLKHNLVAVGLQHRQRIGRLREYQSSLGGVASQRRLVVEELTVPNFLLRLPIDDKPPLNRPTELDLAEVAALLELGGDVRLLEAVAGDAVGHDERRVDVDGGTRDAAGFQRVGAVVDDQSRLGLCGQRRLRLATACRAAVCDHISRVVGKLPVSWKLPSPKLQEKSKLGKKKWGPVRCLMLLGITQEDRRRRNLAGPSVGLTRLALAD